MVREMFWAGYIEDVLLDRSAFHYVEGDSSPSKIIIHVPGEITRSQPFDNFKFRVCMHATVISTLTLE